MPTTAPMIWQLLAVAFGGTIGCLLRWQAAVWLNGRWAGFPLGTLAVNWVGGLFIGALLAWFSRSPNELLRLLLVTGVLGGLTTFSSFSGESLALLQRGHYGLAALHVGAHVLGSLFLAGVGFVIVEKLLGPG